MFEYLAIDWGSKRCGIAFGDIHTELTVPATYQCDTGTVFSVVEKEINAKKITHIVLGLPTNFNLGKTEVTDKILQFKQELETRFPGIVVETIFERNTTKHAKKDNLKDKTMINHLAAQRIMENYFYKKKT